MIVGEALRRLGAVGFKLKLVYTFDLGRNASIGAFRAAAQMSSIFVSSLLGKSSWGASAHQYFWKDCEADWIGEL